jgi:hypothetical protein
LALSGKVLQLPFFLGPFLVTRQNFRLLGNTAEEGSTVRLVAVSRASFSVSNSGGGRGEAGFYWATAEFFSTFCFCPGSRNKYEILKLALMVKIVC